jgi:hypothetical protein
MVREWTWIQLMSRSHSRIQLVKFHQIRCSDTWGENVRVGWAADCAVLRPMQSLTTLRVLIDHRNYGGGADYSVKVVRLVNDFERSGIWHSRFDTFEAYSIESGQVAKIDTSTYSPPEYDRRKVIPQSELAGHYNSAHIFMVTHPDSLGLVAL